MKRNPTTKHNLTIHRPSRPTIEQTHEKQQTNPLISSKEAKLINSKTPKQTMFKLGKKKPQDTEEIEEELVIDEETSDEFGIKPLTNQQAPPTQQVVVSQGVTDLRNYVEELSRRINEITSLKSEIDRLTQMKPTIENYINTLSEILKVLNEIENLLNKLDELRRRL